MIMQPDILHAASRTCGCRVLATDGEVGRLKDLYFDDEKWTVRYLIVHTGSWLEGRQVLVSPYAVRFVDSPARMIVIDLTREKVAGSPTIETMLPISRQQETDFCMYFGYPMYWPGVTYWHAGATPSPHRVCGRAVPAEVEPAGQSFRDRANHLHSARDTVGFQVGAEDASLGRVEDILFDERTWAIRHLLVGTRGWLPGGHVRIAPEWIRSLSWDDRCFVLGIGRATLRQSATRSRKPNAEL